MPLKEQISDGLCELVIMKQKPEYRYLLWDNDINKLIKVAPNNSISSRKLLNGYQCM